VKKNLKALQFKTLYQLYVNKLMRKQIDIQRLDEAIYWMTGYPKEVFIHSEKSLESFFIEAPSIHLDLRFITGKICGVDIEQIKDTIDKYIRQLDKIVDELYKGKSLQEFIYKNKSKNIQK
jgi:hypothetical protein